MSDASTPRFLQGRFPFTGNGFDSLAPIDESLTLTVSDGKTLQAVYFRGGNSSNELVTVTLLRNGVPVRYFPIGAKGTTHVPLRLVEDFDAGEVVELHVTADKDTTGTLIIDLGLVEF
ncbi:MULTISPECIES: molybdopterin oxidoreductase [unclassified Gordonia (in: high G+C Gram-positive bacteria)]